MQLDQSTLDELNYLLANLNMDYGLSSPINNENIFRESTPVLQTIPAFESSRYIDTLPAEQENY
jgi:hypothetical protein